MLGRMLSGSTEVCAAKQMYARTASLAKPAIRLEGKARVLGVACRRSAWLPATGGEDHGGAGRWMGARIVCAINLHTRSIKVLCAL